MRPNRIASSFDSIQVFQHSNCKQVVHSPGHDALTNLDHPRSPEGACDPPGVLPCPPFSPQTSPHAPARAHAFGWVTFALLLLRLATGSSLSVLVAALGTLAELLPLPACVCIAQRVSVRRRGGCLVGGKDGGVWKGRCVIGMRVCMHARV